MKRRIKILKKKTKNELIQEMGEYSDSVLVLPLSLLSIVFKLHYFYLFISTE